MASIEKRTGDNGKPQYRARWRDTEGRSRRSRWFDRKFDAERHRATVEADLHRGSYVDMNNTITVAEFARQWVASRPYRQTTRTNMEGFIRNRLEATPLGPRPLVKVRPSEIQTWATSQVRRSATRTTGELSPLTLRIHTGYLRSIFASAVLDGLIARNPGRRSTGCRSPRSTGRGSSR